MICIPFQLVQKSKAIVPSLLDVDYLQPPPTIVGKQLIAYVGLIIKFVFIVIHLSFMTCIPFQLVI